MSIIGSNILAGASGQSGYNLNNSLRFRASNSAYLSRTFSTPTSGQKWTWSGWIKRGTLSTTQHIFGKGNTSASPWTFLYLATDNTLVFYEYNTGGTAPNFNLATNAVFRDPSAWYHIVVAVDTTLATAANRQIVYVNGVSQTFASSTYYPQNTVTTWNSSGTNNIGYQPSSQYFDGYMTEINFVDGQQLTPSSFGETSTTTGSWIPKKYTGTYGTNGFYLKFADASAATAAAIGKDSSGNGNNWTPSGISVSAGVTYDAMLDVPTNTSATVANYPTMNPLFTYAGRVITYSSANLNVQAGSAAYTPATGTMAIPNTGKWYFEGTLVSAAGSGNDQAFGISDIRPEISATYNVGLDNSAYGYISAFINGTASGNYGAMGGIGTVFQIAIDMDNSKVWLGINNSWIASGNPSTGANSFYTPILTTTYYPYFLGYSSGVTAYNFGQRPFTYTPPSGFVALNTYNLPSSTIPQGNKYMDATTYTGTGAALNVTNAGGFKPDFVWVKDRGVAQQHLIYDSIRGVYNFIGSSSTAAESTNNQTLTLFNSNGFGLGTNGTSNSSAGSFVGWQWQAGQGTTTTGTGTGGITSVTQSVNTTAGFSVVTYTGSGTAGTVTHGLGVAPKMIIFKGRSSTFDWMVYHTSLGNTNYLRLNQTNASAASSSAFNNTSPTSTVFSLGDGSLGNNGSSTQVAYCWAEIAGFSKFGSYTGNGSADGPFVYLGFRPKYFFIKRSDSADTWQIFDSSRTTYNVSTGRNVLFADTSSAEDTSNYPIDFVSNGLKIRNSGNGTNASGGTYIYAAFAENPLKFSNAR